MLGISLGNLVVYLKTDATQFERGMLAAEKRMTQSAEKIKAAGRSMSMYVTAPLALIGGMSVKAFANFDQAMTESLAIMSNVDAEMRKSMENTARTIAKNSTTSAKELAQAYYYLASAGMDAAQSQEALGAVHEFALAGMFDLEKATALATSAQSALGLKVKDPKQNLANLTYVTDMLAGANILAQGSVEDFAKALSNKAAGAMKMLKMPLESGVALLATFAEQGITSEHAGEAFTIVIRDLQRALIKEPGAWKKLGISVYDANEKMRPMSDIVKDLTSRLGGMTDMQKRVTTEQLGFQERSFSYLQMLLGTSDTMKGFEDRLYSMGGASKQIADNQLKGFTAQMGIMKNRVTDAAIGIGEILAPYLIRLNGIIEKGLAWWNGLNRHTQVTIILISAVAASIGPLLIAFGLLTQGVAAVISMFRILTMVAGKWIIAGVLVAAGVWGLVDAFSAADMGFTSFVDGIEVGGFHLQTWFTAVAVVIYRVWDSLWNKLKLGWEWFKFEIQNGLDMIDVIFDSAALSIQESFGGVFSKIATVLEVMIASMEFFGVISKETAANWTGAVGNMRTGVGMRTDEMRRTQEQTMAEAAANEENRTKEYYAKVAALDKDYAQMQATWNDVRDQNVRNDANVKSPGLKESLGKLGAELLKLPGMEGMKAFLDDLIKETVPAAMGPLGGLPPADKIGLPGEEGLGYPGGGGEAKDRVDFQQFALNRLSLAGLAAAAPTKQKQEVTDKEGNARLDKIIGLLGEEGEEEDAVLVE